MSGVDVLVIGSGGREHALAWKLAQSSRIGKLYVAPGNGGTETVATNVPISALDVDGLLAFAKDKRVGLTVVGPDDALAAGVCDKFQAAGQRIFGPTKAAARIESSKTFAKAMMQRAGVPTAKHAVFMEYGKARDYVRKQPCPLVIKADGLALGKGVYVCQTEKDAERALELVMLRRAHGEAGDTVIIEECLSGREISLHAFCDGKTYSLFPTAQDHKPVYDGGNGPNTGGMGTYVPTPWVSEPMLVSLGEKLVGPVLRVLAEDGKPFTGLLYPGLMLNTWETKVLEYNARFGDPETQSYMRLLKSDLLDIMEACLDGCLDSVKVEWHPGAAVCVVVASGGYPYKYEKGLAIHGIEGAEKTPGAVVFHAGTRRENGELLTAGGRVLGVTAVGLSFEEARERAYQAVQSIHFQSMHFRTDIGRQVLLDR